MKSSRFRSGQWFGSYYVRGGFIRDKHNNIYKKPITLRQRSSGIVIDTKGNWIGKEPIGKNNWGQDYKKTKKPKGWYGESIRHSLARKGIKTK